MIQVPNMSIEKLLSGLRLQIFQSASNHRSSPTISMDGIPDSIEKLFEMLKDANYLFDNCYMSLQALADRIIPCSPSEIRIALWNSSAASKSMFDFSKAAERAVPLG